MRLRQLSKLLLPCTVLAAALSVVTETRGLAAEAKDVPEGEIAGAAPQRAVRWGGVLSDPFAHRKADVNSAAKAATVSTPGGWRGYGFPVKPSYRWGWFGAEHYYPRVLWHRGYNNDCCRWSYRRGY